MLIMKMRQIHTPESFLEQFSKKKAFCNALRALHHLYKTDIENKEILEAMSDEDLLLHFWEEASTWMVDEFLQFENLLNLNLTAHEMREIILAEV